MGLSKCVSVRLGCELHRVEFVIEGEEKVTV